MNQRIVGWDVGGAHLKAVVVEEDGSILNVVQQACPLWKGLDYLTRALSDIMTSMTADECVHVITMTGELVDLFDSRDDGVKQIIVTMQHYFAQQPVYFYAGKDGFLTAKQIKKQHYVSIASANWLASASLAANQLNHGLFVDIGSTTTDVLVLADGQVQAIGTTDYQRMVSGELLYTGIVRSAVMAVVQSVCFKGQEMGLMMEYFATMADIYRLTGELNETHDQTDTADGAEKTVLASAKRLSRMTGYDYCEKELALWQQLASHIKLKQVNKIADVCERQLSRGLIAKDSYFIGAGVGRFLVKQIAESLGHPYVDFDVLFEKKYFQSELMVADCAPAAAVALLFGQQGLG